MFRTVVENGKDVARYLLAVHSDGLDSFLHMIRIGDLDIVDSSLNLRLTEKPSHSAGMQGFTFNPS